MSPSRSSRRDDRRALELFVAAGFGQGSADLEAEIVEVGLFTGRDRLAASLTLGFLGAAGDVDRHVNLDLRVEGDGHVVQADGLDRLVDGDLVAIDREA